MPSLRYRDHYISVFHLPDKSGKSSCIPCVEIRHKHDRALSARLMLNESFSTAHDASEHGFATGKQWVDQQSAHKRPVSALSEVLEPIRFRLKSWFASRA